MKQPNPDLIYKVLADIYSSRHNTPVHIEVFSGLNVAEKQQDEQLTTCA